MKVRRRFFPLMTVIGPLISESECFVNRLTSDLIKVVFPVYLHKVEDIEGLSLLGSHCNW